jgi:NAD dependent epimerase/dehydratase family enzyme
MGSGEHGYSAWVHTDDLISGLNATVADITIEGSTD